MKTRENPRFSGRSGTRSRASENRKFPRGKDKVLREISKGIFMKGRNLYTKSAAPGTRVYDERILKKGGNEFREWDPRRSKLSVAIMKGLRKIPINEDSVILYLGAANGTTVSHVADIAFNGRVFAVEFSPRAIMDLIFVAKDRNNIIPILESAFHPKNYKGLLEPVDLVYQDVAQKNQAEILIKNCKAFIKHGGYAMIAVKARSIDVTKKPVIVFREVERKLRNEFHIIDKRRLEPFKKDHMFYLLKMK